MTTASVGIYLLQESDEEAVRRLRRNVVKDQRGKPFFSDCPQKYLSISHSGGWFAAAVSDSQVGIDLQAHSCREGESMEAAADRYRKIGRRFFHETENAYLDGCATEDFLHRFFRLWTGKESYVKYTGSGIDDDFASFSVVSTGMETGIWQAMGVSFLSLEVMDGFTLCVCSERVANADIRETITYRREV